MGDEEGKQVLMMCSYDFWESKRAWFNYSSWDLTEVMVKVYIGIVPSTDKSVWFL